ncbi:hypothetical protein LRM36_12775 [Stenotrophomonas maltophilia]|jgi:hypothetical protein|nr:hypothetical protein [Stenotrophomonas maltophilia]
MFRWDLSSELIHFIQGETPVAACTRLRRILKDGYLQGGNYLITGGYAKHPSGLWGRR